MSFGLGVLTARNWRTLEDRAQRWTAGRRWAWPLVLVVAVLLTTARWNLTGLGVDPPLLPDHLLRVATTPV